MSVPRSSRPLAATAALILAGLALTACDSEDVPAPRRSPATPRSESPEPRRRAVRDLRSTSSEGATDVPVDTELARDRRAAAPSARSRSPQLRVRSR